MKISVVSPVYRAEGIIDILVDRIIEALSQVTKDFEIILVEDGSPDKSWEQIKKNCSKDKRIKGYKLSRNFGQHYAITAGLEKCKGDWIIVMDCDLQDRPEEIPFLLKETELGYDVVLARRLNRKDSWRKRFVSLIYYKTLGYLTDTKQNPSVANYGVYKNKVIKSILEMGDYYRFLPTMVQWVGYEVGYLDVEHSLREEGRSSYNFSKLIKLGLDNIISFSDKLLRLTIKIGFIVTLFALLFGGITLYRYYSGAITELGFASLILSIWFLSGLILFTLGIVGMYIGKSFDTVKNRPRFIISEKLNEEE